MQREQQLAGAFVELADTLVDDFDLIGFLHRLTQLCVDLLEVMAVGILLTDQTGHLQPVAASSEQARLLELFQLQSEEGPCLECFATGEAIVISDLATSAEGRRWPMFADKALAAGFTGLVALPMRLRHQRIGAMNLFTAGPHEESSAGVDVSPWAVAQAFADVATIGILGERTAREHHLLAHQLQTALNSRVIIEQAKGMLAERGHISVDHAFNQMRDFARHSNRKLVSVAQSVIDNDPTVAPLIDSHPTHP
jgi:transcriptional regulator with GAF, ATPase, and Fis domain